MKKIDRHKYLSSAESLKFCACCQVVQGASKHKNGILKDRKTMSTEASGRNHNFNHRGQCKSHMRSGMVDSRVVFLR